MSARVVDHPDDWSLGARPTPTGVRVELAIPGAGILGAGIELTREEARLFAAGVLAAAGDGTERTFPRPPIEPDHG